MGKGVASVQLKGVVLAITSTHKLQTGVAWHGGKSPWPWACVSPPPAGDAAQAILLKPLVLQLWNIVGHYLKSPVAASGGGQPIVLVLQPQQHGDAKDQANAVTAVISLAALQQGKDVDADGVTPKEAVEAVLAPYLKHVVGWRERPTVREVVHRQVPLTCCAWHGVVRVLDLPRTALRHVQDLLLALAMASGAGAGRASLGVPVSHPGPALAAAAEAAEDIGGVEVDGEDAVPQVDSHHLPVPGTVRPCSREGRWRSHKPCVFSLFS